MERYNSYKDSGVEWIGDIPSHWDKKRFSYSFNLQKGKIPKELTDERYSESLPYLSMSVLRGEEPNEFSTEEGLVIVHENDIGLLWDGSNSGEVIKINQTGILSSTVSHLSSKDKKLSQDFSLYLLKFYEKDFKNNTIGMGIPHVDGDHVKESKILIPPLSEQQQIVSFLDTKTSLIDSLIEKTQRKIELLKEKRTSLINEVITKGLNPNVEMKDSGVEWIGDIPSHWDRTKIKRHCEVKDGTHDTPQYLDIGENTVPLVTSNSFVKGEIDFTVSKHISFDDYLEINRRSNVTVDDIIMSMIGSNIGNRVLVKSSQPFSIKNVCLFKTSESDSLIPKYLIYLIDSKYLKYQIDFNQKGGGQPFLSLDELRNLLFPFPPLSEQQQIVSYLDEQTQKIDKTISIEEKRIELLKEYRQSLISEVVTGKRKVIE